MRGMGGRMRQAAWLASLVVAGAGVVGIPSAIRAEAPLGIPLDGARLAQAETGASSPSTSGDRRDEPPRAGATTIPSPDEPIGRKVVWGAIAFTAGGSYSSAWRYPTKAEAEAEVLKKCAKFGDGKCEVIAFEGRLCAALASYNGRGLRVAYTGAGLTVPERLTEIGNGPLQRRSADAQGVRATHARVRRRPLRRGPAPPQPCQRVTTSASAGRSRCACASQAVPT